jgi:chromosome segregation ATPase
MELQALEMRLDNLEKKMDEVVKLTQILPRLEERLINQKDDLSDHERRLRALEASQSKDNVVVGWVERFAWALIAGVISLAFYFLR